LKFAIEAEMLKYAHSKTQTPLSSVVGHGKSPDIVAPVFNTHPFEICPRVTKFKFELSKSK